MQSTLLQNHAGERLCGSVDAVVTKKIIACYRNLIIPIDARKKLENIGNKKFNNSGT
jgi:hypothetical protein